MFHSRSLFLRITCFIPVLIVFSIIGFLYFGVVFRIAFPKLIDPSEDKLKHILFVIQIHVLVVPLVVSYWRCVSTDPGTVSGGWDENDLEKSNPPPRYCEKCGHYKPLRCHHCSVCERCVLRMDHHCPWVGNCVGWKNHKFFLLFVFYGFIESSFVALYSGHYFLNGLATMEYFVVVAVTYIISLSLAISLFVFSVFHIYLVLNGMTTIECHQISHRDNPNNFGWRRNLSQIFGEAPFWQMILPFHPQNLDPSLVGVTLPTIVQQDMDFQDERSTESSSLLIS